MYDTIYRMVCQLYADLLREILLKAVDDPNSDWDDFLMSLADKLFGYN